ncbi:wax ester/triacylglycerol synthase family O-acyltransferase [Intrasporangium flavum]|uniref:wax ester/triacylglycerol synthase family O-acyltransferase n=1 Tax=Intrasporangium flavum TaxID=1428657 RepID=UPI00096D445B|nr:wax ester/triacylglycerol synthase family O-acyltransferase [Intrasporangium flavum]
MGSADVLWLTMDRPTNLMVVVSVVLLESVPDWDRVLEVLRTRIVEPYPVFSQRPRRSARVLGRWLWEDDPDFDLARHVRRATLSGQGTAAEADAELQAYVEEQLPRPFDRTRPLWEVHLVDGHGSGAALVFRSHHALADGIALTRVLLGLTEDADGVPGDLVGPSAAGDLPPLPVGGPAASGALSAGLRLARSSARSAWNRLRSKGARAAVTDAAGITLRTGQVVSDLLLTTNPTSAVGGVPGRRKRLVWTEPLPLGGLKGVGRLVGATLNDVLLSAVAGALHEYQQEHGHPPVDLVTMVPVNVRPLDEPLPRELGNRFALVFLRFPSGDATPLGRLALSKARMDWLKASPEAALTFALISVIGRLPAAIERWVVDFFADKAIGVTTNVAGPRQVRYLAGVPVAGVLGWVPGSGRHTLGFCIVTYDDTLRVGIMADESVVPDPEALLAALEEEVALLVRIGAAAPTPGSRRRRS